MSIRNAKSLSLLLGAALMLGIGGAAWADDTEIYLGQSSTASDPNIMFIFDTSGSMGTVVSTTQAFDPAQNYSGSGSCSGAGSRIYFVSGNRQGTPPNCNSTAWFNPSLLKCAAARPAMTSGGTGIYQDALIRWGGNNASKQWSRTLTVANGTDVECLHDKGVDGNLSATNPYPDKNAYASGNGVWTATAAQSYWNSGQQTTYTLYSGNYVTWYNQFRTTVLGTRLSIMQSAAATLLNSLSGVNVGLMRYSNNGGRGDQVASGGMVAYPVSPIETDRASLITAVNGYTANGYTPLSETLYESYLYFSGKPVYFGLNSVPFASVAASRDPANTANYKSPMNYSCQKNYIVYLTDGLPTADTEANSLITGLPNEATLGGACIAGNGDGACLGALAQYMFRADLRSGASDPAGQQNVSTYFIGLGSDFVDSATNQLNAAFSYLNTAATRGGGQAYQANDLSDLTDALTTITAQIKQSAATFTAPTVAVNAFNQTKSLSDLYVSMFQPSATWHWPGNVKKYKLASGVIVDSGNNPAVDPSTGFFADSSQSIWAPVPDGSKVDTGGAANKLPDPATRRIYTYPYPGVSNVTAGSSNPIALTGSANYVVGPGNALLTDALLNTDTVNDPGRLKLLTWARGTTSTTTTAMA